MRKIAVVLLLASVFASAQAAPPAQTTDAPPSSPMAPTQEKEATEVGPSTPVITLQGLCPNTPGADPKSPDCKTVVTRAEFERLVTTLAPQMPGSAKQQLAGDYTKMLIFSNEAKKRGIDKTERFRDILEFMKMRVLSQELLSSLQQQAKPTPAEIQKVYDENQQKYEELTLSRIFIPRNRPAAEEKPKTATGTKTGAAAKPAAAKAPAGANQATDAELQAEGEKALARLKAGESFEKVQKDLYEAAGFKTPPPPTTIPNWRRDAAGPDQQQIFDLKKGEMSGVKVEPAGAYIYRVDDKKPIPLEQARPEIESNLLNQHMQQTMTNITGSVKPEFNQAYFRSMSAEGEGAMPMPQGPAPAPGSNPPMARPSPK